MKISERTLEGMRVLIFAAALLTSPAAAQDSSPETAIDAEATAEWCLDAGDGWILQGVALGAPFCEHVSGHAVMTLRVYQDGTRWLFVTGPETDIYTVVWQCFDASNFRMLGPVAPNVTILERSNELARLVINDGQIIVHMAPRGTPMFQRILESMRVLGATPTPGVL